MSGDVRTTGNALAKPGWKTTEFWLTLALNAAAVLSMLSGILPGERGITAIAIANALYAFARTWSKRTGAGDANLRQEILQAVGGNGGGLSGGNHDGGLHHNQAATDRPGPTGGAGPAG